MRGRLVVVALAALAVGVVAAFSGSDHGTRGRDRSATGGRATPSTLRLTFVYSPEKERLVRPLVARFNAERHRLGDRKIVIDGRVMPSGEAEDQIARGRQRPVLWSPASSLWGRLLNFEADRRLVADVNPSIARTPLVIGMWKRLADAYGYPRHSLGYGDLARLATRGWRAVGRPAFGAFKYVHTNPDFSTSGLSAVVASYYAAAGKREALTAADVRRARPQVRRLERAIVHYGDTTLFIEGEMRRHGLGYASAAAMQETTLIDFNRRAGRGERLVAVYPHEGTFASDNPIITLRGDWVSAQQRRAGGAFARFLKSAVTSEVAGREGFRPADPDDAPAGLVTAANGVDPRRPARYLSMPEPRVLAAIKAAWRADRKPANVMAVFDASSSMGEDHKLERATEGLKALFRAAGDQDRFGLMRFSGKITPLVPIAPMKRNRARLLRATDAILPDGETRLRDATIAAVRAVADRLDPHAINAVVLLTDGQDTVSTRSASDVERELARQGRNESGAQIRVFTIAYGGDANVFELEDFAAASGGRSYRSDQSDIRSIYLAVSSFF